MRTRLLNKLGAFALAVLILAACTPKTDIVNYVPEGAVLVGVMDLESIAEKGEMKNFSESNIYNAIKSNALAGDEKGAKIFEDFVKNPSETGVDFSEKIYMFVTGEKDYFCVAAKLGSKEKFDAFVKKMREASDAKKDIKKEDKFSYLEGDDDESTMAWDDSKMMMIFATGEKKPLEGAKALMAGNPETSITNNPSYTEFAGNLKDMSVWVKWEMFEWGEFGQMNMAKEMGFDMSGTEMSFHLNFTEGAIDISTDMKPNEKFKENFDLDKIIRGGLPEDMLAKLPKDNTLAMYGIAYNLKEYWESLDKVIPTLDAETINSFVEPALGVEFSELIEFFTGEMAVAFHGMGNQAMMQPTQMNGAPDMEMQQMGPMPMFTLIAKVNKKDIYPQLTAKFDEFLTGMGEEEGITFEKNEDRYTINAGPVTVWAGLWGDYLIVTNYADLANNAESGYGDNSMNNHELSDKFKGSPASFYMNINFDSYPDNVKSMISQAAGPYLAFAMPYLEIYDSIVAFYEEGYSGTLSIRLKNKDKNSLKVIMDNVDGNM